MTHYRSAYVRDVVESHAAASGLDYRSLASRVALHLPKYADKYGQVSSHAIHFEAGRQADILKNDLTIAFSAIPAPDCRAISLSETSFELLDRNLAKIIFQRMHFLRTWRAQADYFALVDPAGVPVACCGLAEIRWPKLTKKLSMFHLPFPLTIYDFCRVYALPWAPRNSISALLSQTCRMLGQSPKSVDLVCTAVDPNIGFTGSSYKAANWTRALTVRHLPYRYVDGEHQTMGQIERRYHVLNSGALRRRLGTRYQESACALVPKDIYLRPINPATRHLVERLGSELTTAARAEAAA